MNQCWKYGVLDDAVIKGSSNVSLNKIKDEEGDYPVFGAKGFAKNVSFFQQEQEYLAIIKDGAGIGRVSKHPKKSSVLATMQYLIPKEGFDIGFVEYFLNGIDFEKYRNGSTIPHIYFKDYKTEQFPILPLSEQKRIVTILDKVFAGISQAMSNAEINLANARQLFKSVLDASMTGKLTESWRLEAELANGEAQVDLENLLNEVGGVARKPSRKAEETVGHNEILDVIPNAWSITSIESLFKFIDYRGKNPPRSESGKRLITAKNIRMGYINNDPITFISEDTYKKWMVRGFPMLGDIFFITEGHTMGFVAFNDRSDQFALAQRTITLQPFVSIPTKFFFYYMMSSYFQKIIKINATGAAAVGMKAAKLRTFPLPFPSPAEQNVILEILDKVSVETQRLETIYKHKITALVELKRSVLQKVFIGELLADATLQQVNG